MLKLLGLPGASMIAGLLIVTLSSAHAGGACQVESGSTTAALVELYTSEGCSSCPPADEALRAVRRSVGPHGVVVPLALHVSYWDQIGWKDVFAQKTFDARQSTMVATSGGKVVYTPQFFVNGRELRTWSHGLPGAIAAVNSTPSKVRIKLKTSQSTPGTILLEATADDGPTSGRYGMFVALSESELVSHVTRGENSGATLRHDDTVRSWIGPLALASGTGHIKQEIPIPPGWNPQHLQAVAFVQDLDKGNVLQAVSTTQCSAASRP